MSFYTGYTKYMSEDTPQSCVFCEIVKGESFAEIVFESEDFIVIPNKYPKAPVHLLVVDKKHNKKQDTISGKYSANSYWDKLFDTIYGAILKFGLDKTGYKLVNNGAGYNHFEHEHFHILGGSSTEPGGQT